MPYDKQTWINGRAGATATSASRFSHMEDGIDTATNLAEGLASTAVTVLDVATSGTDVTNTAAETTFATTTIPAGSLGTKRWLVARNFFDFLNNSGSGQTFRVKVKINNVIVYDATSPSIPSVNARRAGCIELYIGEKSPSTASQRSGGRITLSDTTAPTVGTGALTTNDLIVADFQCIDSTADATASISVDITIQLSAATTTLSFRRLSKLVLLA